MSIQTVLRTLVASGLVVGTVAALSPAAFAAGDGGQVSGNVASIERVDYTAASITTPISTTNMDQSDLDFGKVNVQSNAPGGWTLKVKSLNGSALKNGAGDVIAYTMTVGGATVDVSTPNTDDTAKNVSTLTDAADGGQDYAVVGAIASTQSNGKPAGNYADTLTFTLTNK